MGIVWRRHHRRGRPRRQPLRVQIRISNSLVAAKRVPRRGRRPDVASNSALGKRRGRRECRVMASPMARLQQKKQAAVTTGSARSTGIPCAMVYGLYRALPGDRAFLPPSSARSSRDLSLSVGRPGPHDFAVRVSHVRLTCPPRPSHPRPTYRDDRPKRPSSSRRDAREHRFDLPDAASADACGRLARRAIGARVHARRAWRHNHQAGFGESAFQRMRRLMLASVSSLLAMSPIRPTR